MMIKKMKIISNYFINSKMSFPLEIELYIISFIPFSELALVCKEWEKKINYTRKKSSLIIEKFYLKNKIKDNVTNNTQLIRLLSVKYENKYFLPYPELSIRKLGLNTELLTLLPPLKDRKRSDVKTWMLNMPITFSEWLYVGM